MADKLPLRVRASIRDDWDSSDSEVQKALKGLSECIGPNITAEPNWDVLWRELRSNFPDPAVLVPNVSRIVQQWASILMLRLENDDLSDWTDTFLEAINGASRFKLCIGIQRRGNALMTFYDSHAKLFYLELPKGPLPDWGNAANSLRSAFERMFEPDEPEASSFTAAKDEGWAAVDLPSQAAPPTQQKGAIAATSVVAFPSLSMLPRPEMLFTDVVPYYLTVTALSSSFIVQGSHEPSIKLIADYFQKWSKAIPNLTVKKPMLKIELKDSNFGISHFYDSVHFEIEDNRSSWIHSNPVTVLAFIEGVLGYELVHQHGSYWCFKRTEKYAH